MSVPAHLFIGIVRTEKGRINSMQPKNCIAVSLFTIVLYTDFVDESNKNRIAVLLFIGQCWRITPTLSWGERCKSNAIGVAFEASSNPSKGGESICL